MWRTVQHFYVVLTVIIFYCGTNDCLQINQNEPVVDKLEIDQINPEEPQFEKLVETNKNPVENVLDDKNKFMLYDKLGHEEFKTKNKIKITDTTAKKRIRRQTTLANGYTHIYPQVPSASPYGYQTTSQQPQWNGNQHNIAQPGYQNYSSPYNPSYNPNQGPYNPSYNPNQGAYNSSYNPNQGPYNTNIGSYNPNQSPYPQTAYNSSQGPYNTNYGLHNTSQSNYKPYPNQGSSYPGQYNNTQSPYRPTQSPFGATHGPYNQPPYNPSYGPYNQTAALNPYGGYASQKPYNTSTQQYPSYTPSGYGQINNSYSGQQHFNTNHPSYNPSMNPYNFTTPLAPYNPGQNLSYNNSYSQGFPNRPGSSPSQNPQNFNPYGQNLNPYSQYPNNYPQNPNAYPHKY